LFNCRRAHLGRSTPRSSLSPATYTLCGSGHGGTRNRSTSRNLQTGPVSPPAMAGVPSPPCLAQPLPCAGSGLVNRRAPEEPATPSAPPLHPPAGALGGLTPTLPSLPGHLPAWGLGPGRHADPEPFPHGPGWAGHPRRHGWRPEPPLPGRTAAVGGLGLGQRQ